MRFACHCAVLLTCAVLVNPSRADTADVLRLIPHQADLLVKIEQPRTLVEGVINHRLVNDLYQIDAIRDQLERLLIERNL